MLQSLALHEQSYGFLHPATAKCYSALAMYFYHNEDLEIAIDFQKKAVVVLERTCGVDSVDAVHGYVSINIIIISCILNLYKCCFASLYY